MLNDAEGHMTNMSGKHTGSITARQGNRVVLRAGVQWRNKRFLGMHKSIGASNCSFLVLSLDKGFFVICTIIYSRDFAPTRHGTVFAWALYNIK